MTKAGSVHTRVQVPKSASVVEPKNIATTTQSETPIAMQVKSEANQTFDEFYPLHVTRVEQKSGGGWGAIVIGIVVLLTILGLTLWYVQQQSSTATSTPAQTATKTTAIPISSPSSSGDEYQNSIYKFAFTKPASWASVKAEETPIASKEAGSPVMRIRFLYPTSSSLQDVNVVPLAVVRIDTKQSYEKESSLIKAEGKDISVVYPLLFDTGTYLISMESQLNAEQAAALPATSDGLKAAVHDTSTALGSLKVL